MKKLKYIILFISVLISSPVISSYNMTTHQTNIDGSDYTVVIGAFAIYRNAQRFAGHASEQSYNAKYEFNPNRNLYYVFTLKTDDKDQAMGEAKRLREETSFTDAWVYHGALGKSTPQEDIDPISEQKIEQITVSEVETPPAVVTPPVVEKKLVEENLDNTEGSKKFIFQLYRASDNETVKGDVDIIDPDKAKKLASYEGNKPVLVSPPDNASGNISFISKIFGYRKIQKDINFNKPEGESVSTDDQNAVVIPFELVRLQKGDIVVMYNVFFYKDAAVMMPESQYEVHSLLEMMNENPKCKIALHGHTNGGASGKIISIGESKNFFSLSGTKSGFGSAKQLSEERAEVIKSYLMENGIAADRIKVEAWGGKRPLYDKEGAHAKENVRVEVEILEDK